MTCGEFKEEFKNRVILAFVLDVTTKIYKFESKHITFFLRKFIDDYQPDWRRMYFYSVANLSTEITEDGKITKFEDKAEFLYVTAKHVDQKHSVCTLKRVYIIPDMRHLEGHRAKVLTLSF